MRWRLVGLLLGGLVVGGLVGAGVALATGPGEGDVRAAAMGLVPVGADVVDEVVEAPPVVSPVRAVGVRVSFLSESTDEVARAAEEAGWEVVAPDRFRRGGLGAIVTGPVERDGEATVAVFVERNADTLSGRLLVGAIVGALAGGTLALTARTVARSRTARRS